MRIGFVGMGNMATAIIEGLYAGGPTAHELGAFDIDASKTAQLRSRHADVQAFADNQALAAWADIVVLAVKPQHCMAALSQMREGLQGKALLSIAAGLSTASLKEYAPSTRILKAMPNTPLLVGVGMTALSRDTDFRDDERAVAESLFSIGGLVEWVEEGWMHGVTALSGSGPAYGYIFIEAMADAGVKLGLPRALSYRLAAQALKGSGAMVLGTGRHPAGLKDDVCSPGGTTIEAVLALEECGFRHAVEKAVLKNAEKSARMNG